MKSKTLLLLAFAAAPATVACLPPATCTPGTSRCDNDTPTTCSSTGREWAVSSPRVRCAEVGAVCAVRDNIAACVRPEAPTSNPDAGVSSRVVESPVVVRAKGGA